MFEPGKVVSDLNGRFIIVAGKLQNTPVILASVYGPGMTAHSYPNYSCRYQTLIIII